MTVSLLLMPAGETAAMLDAAIADYACTQRRTPFKAHLTLATASNMTTAPEDALDKLAARTTPLTLVRGPVLRTESFGRSFALTFAATDELLALREDARSLTEDPLDKEPFLPHVSLTYEPPAEVAPLEALAKRVAQTMRFDALQSLTHTRVSSTQADVAAWRYGPRHAFKAA